MSAVWGSVVGLAVVIAAAVAYLTPAYIRHRRAAVRTEPEQ